MDGDFQYIADTFLIERMFNILAETENGKESLEKQAQLGSTLSSIGNSIKSFIGSQIHGKDSGGVTRTIVNFLAPAMFFRLHPILGILVTAAQFFGLDLYSIYERIVNIIKPSIENGQPVSAQAINDAARASVPASDESTELGAESSDFLYPLREIQKKGSLTKEGIGSFTREWGNQPFVPDRKYTNPFVRMFGFLGRRRGGSLIIGILVWFLKTVLLSAGLLAVGGAVAGVLGAKPKTDTQTGSQQQEEGPGAGRLMPVSQISIPSPTSAGAINYRPNSSDMWVEVLEGDQPHQRVLQWTIESYPDLYEYQDIVLRTPSFWNVVRNISQSWRPGQRQLVIPGPYKTRNEVLAMFIPDVYSLINQQRMRGMQ